MFAKKLYSSSSSLILRSRSLKSLPPPSSLIPHPRDPTMFAKVLQQMLPNYHHHVRTYANTLITKFFGLHSIKPYGGQKLCFRMFSKASRGRGNTKKEVEPKKMHPNELHKKRKQLKKALKEREKLRLDIISYQKLEYKKGIPQKKGSRAWAEDRDAKQKTLEAKQNGLKGMDAFIAKLGEEIKRGEAEQQQKKK